MGDPREAAHTAMRELWGKANSRLKEDDVNVWYSGGGEYRFVETERGASISQICGMLSLSAEFEKPNGTQETIHVDFPDDIRDLSEAVVLIDWVTADRKGTNTPPLRDYPRIADELIALV
jgi:hypothetical protein